jgi:hypothetical protein
MELGPLPVLTTTNFGASMAQSEQLSLAFYTEAPFYGSQLGLVSLAGPWSQHEMVEQYSSNVINKRTRVLVSACHCSTMKMYIDNRLMAWVCLSTRIFTWHTGHIPHWT